MVLTRAIDNRLKTFFTSGEIRFRGGERAREGLPLSRPRGHLRRRASGFAGGASFRGALMRSGGETSSAPLIRDLGAALAMKRER